MTIYTLPVRPNQPLPVASPRACDTSLLHALIRDRSGLVGWAKALEPRCRSIQLRYTRGTWQSDRELRNVNRQVIAVLKAQHAHRRELDAADIETLDRLAEYAAGIPMALVNGRAA